MIVKNSIGLRIKEIRSVLNLTQNEFSDKLEIKQSNLSHIENKSEKISIEIIDKIISNFNINANWLFTGKGEMINVEPEKNQPAKTIEETRPRIPMDAAAGALSIASEGVTVENTEQIPLIKAFSKYDFTIFARGDSMEPEFHSGDELACLYLKATNFIQWGRYHVLDTTQGVLVKRIFEDDEYIICKSDNSEYYKDFKIHKSEIYNLALVVGCIRRY